jgi:methyl-accepting chemotaxis protein
MDGNTIISELKQFISATVTQQTIDLRQEIKRLDKKIDDKIGQLDKKIDELDNRLSNKIDTLEVNLGRVEKKLSDRIDNLSAHIAQALDTSNDTTDSQLARHEKRITRLERHTKIIV